MFQVFVGHATGQPNLRYLLLTDQFIYLMACSGNQKYDDNINKNVVDDEKSDVPPRNVFSQNSIIEEVAVEAFERNLLRINNGPPKKFTILVSFYLYLNIQYVYN